MKHLLLFLLLLNSSLAIAQGTKTYEGEFGKNLAIPMAANDPTESIQIAFRSNGNQPIGFEFNLEAPKNTEITFQSIGFPQNKTLAQAISSLRGFNTISIAFSGAKFLPKLTIGKKSDSSSGGGGGATGYVCNHQLSRRYVDYYSGVAKDVLGHYPTLAELCEFLFPGSNGEDEEGGGSAGNGEVDSVTVVGLLLKNACVKNLSYAGILTLNLKNIPAEVRAAGYTITLDSKGEDYEGDTRFKVKRMGDGRFKEPLLLGASVGSGSASPEYHLFTRWTAGKLKSSGKLSIAKTLGYRGSNLGATRPRKYLTGGKAVVFVTNGEKGYGVCIKAVASDQLYNGYTN